MHIYFGYKYTHKYMHLCLELYVLMVGFSVDNMPLN
uniref:Uncharacterized protein n=1 Tax=Anguilla anguilla TaxID=7936 RepID=A0A0E9SMP0_ANGAN